MAKAVYTTLRYLSASRDPRPRGVGIAVPLEQREELVEPIRPVLTQLGIVVFLVSHDRTVKVIGRLI